VLQILSRPVSRNCPRTSDRVSARSTHKLAGNSGDNNTSVARVYGEIMAWVSGAPANDFAGASARVKAALHASALRGLDTRGRSRDWLISGRRNVCSPRRYCRARHARENSRGNARGRAFHPVSEITRVFRRTRREMSCRNSPVCVLFAGLLAHQAAPRRERPLNGAGAPSAPATGVVHVSVPGPH
jgi:hypothetical protein